MGRWSTRLAPDFVGFAGLPESGRFVCLGDSRRSGWGLSELLGLFFSEIVT